MHPLPTTPPRPADAPVFPPSRRHGAIVLVHGAWVGEWSWAPVVPLLERSGRAVYAVSLTGHGVRRRDGGPHVTLDDHVRDVVDVFDVHDLRDVTLVAHSYGGRVITRAWPFVADRVARVVYLDAHAPLVADASVSASQGLPPAVGGMVPFDGYPPDPAEFGGDGSVAWFLDRTVPQSAATLDEPFDAVAPTGVELVYVHATADPLSRFRPYADAARAHTAWRYEELDCSHWVMIARPHDVAAIVLDEPEHPDHPNHSDDRTTR